MLLGVVTSHPARLHTTGYAQGGGRTTENVGRAVWDLPTPILLQSHWWLVINIVWRPSFRKVWWVVDIRLRSRANLQDSMPVPAVSKCRLTWFISSGLCAMLAVESCCIPFLVAIIIKKGAIRTLRGLCLGSAWTRLGRAWCRSSTDADAMRPDAVVGRLHPCSPGN